MVPQRTSKKTTIASDLENDMLDNRGVQSREAQYNLVHKTRHVTVLQGIIG